MLARRSCVLGSLPLSVSSNCILISAESPALTAKLDCPNRVASIVFSPDGSLVIAGHGWGDPAAIRVWSVSDRALVNSGEGPSEKAIRSVAISPDGKLLVAANRAGNVLLWELGA